ncbi:MAG: AMP-binding protein, partial [bacterium]|nr:AMP-binding protein [bacterium]
RLTAAKEAFFRPFDLKQAPLLRVGLIKIKDTPTGQLLLLDMHHIITDGTSQEVLTKELFDLKTGKNLPPLKLQYRDYAEWQNSSKQKRLIKGQEEAWLKIFPGEIPELTLPTDYPRPIIRGFEGSHIAFQLTKEETAKLKETAKQNETTLYMAILSIFTILLSKLSGQEDIIVGTPTAGRRHAQLEKIIGMFVNTLAMRNYPQGEKTFKAFLREVKENSLFAFENQEYQFEDLVDRLSLRRDTGRNPIFDVMFNLLNQAEYQKQTLSTTSSTSTMSTMSTGSTISGNPHTTMFANEPVNDANGAEHRNAPGAVGTNPGAVGTNPGAVGTSKFDLTLSATDSGERVYLHIEYYTKLFKEETIKRFITYFKKILQSVTAAPEQKIKEIEFITAEEKHQILHDFNDTTVHYPKGKTIHQLFEEQAQRTPDSIGTVGSWQSAALPPTADRLPPTASLIQLTYRELNETTGRLARHLQEKGAKPGTIVAIMLERSTETIIAIISILKAGAAYLPIDPAYPNERINYILKDSSTKIVLTGYGEIRELNEIKESKKLKHLGEEIELIDISIVNRHLSSTSPQPHPSSPQHPTPIQPPHQTPVSVSTTPYHLPPTVH